MQRLRLNERMTLAVAHGNRSTCYSYAVSELARLLGRLGVQVEKLTEPSRNTEFRLCLAASGARSSAAKASTAGVKADGFILKVQPDAVAICAKSAKGVLNGVYELAERMGFVFLLPTDEWEWPPAGGWRGVKLDCGLVRMNPRFAWRGLYGLSADDFTQEQWLRYYAKLKFNAMGCMDPKQAPLMEELGLRIEIGDHGMASLLPRKLFKTQPELFRMFQPEDFRGQRRDDSNFCAANPKTRRIIQDNFRKTLRKQGDVYAAHAWADDLPGGGWCMCSLCRGLTATDQYLLAMRHLADVIRKEKPSARLAVIAYHDTIAPPTAVEAPPEGFLLYAPRERCYGHALDDPSCYRNRIYLQALKGWMKRFANNPDPHTFEYYFDQLLFRGMYPFLPGVVLDDMRVYQACGIESHMSIMVWGPEIAPEFGMLAFAKGHWDEALTPERFIADIAARMQPENPAPWRTYLGRRQAIFESAMRFCDYPFELYLDYRWLPESSLPFARKMAGVYARASEGLASAADGLRKSSGSASRGLKELAKREVARAKFEAAELRVMALQQDGVNHLGRFLACGDRKGRSAGLASLRKASKAIDVARGKALALGVPPEGGYVKSYCAYLQGEINRKIRTYAGA